MAHTKRPRLDRRQIEGVYEFYLRFAFADGFPADLQTVVQTLTSLKWGYEGCAVY
jgi:hypothetical protein